jgi:head-tail adaptor
VNRGEFSWRSPDEKPSTNKLNKSNRSRAQQRDKEQADPKRCWPCAESLWSHHAYEPCEERKQTGHEQYNETETFNISPANDHTAIMRLVPRKC